MSPDRGDRLRELGDFAPKCKKAVAPKLVLGDAPNFGAYIV